MLKNYTKAEMMDLSYELAGKTAIITGGAAGIGRMTAEYFLNRE